MIRHALKYLIFLIFVPNGNCWSYNPFCWIGKCNTEKSDQRSSYMDYLEYSLTCLPWNFENESGYSWSTLNPYCWIINCHGIDKQDNENGYSWSNLNPYCWIVNCQGTDKEVNNFSDFIIFRPYCWFLDCNNKKDPQPNWFSFKSHIPWIEKKDEGPKQNEDNSKYWKPSAFNPLCWFGRCSKNIGVEKSHLFSMNDFVNAAKRYGNPRNVINQLKSIPFNPSHWLGESCNDAYIPGDVNKLSALLEKHLHGQHLVNDILIAALGSHLSKEAKSKKALAMSFHGWTGSGKNYVASMVAESLFKLGTKSKYMHHFSARVLFTLDSKVDEYRENLYQWLKSNVTLCARQLFVFDEVDMMPEGILDAITPMIDYRGVVDGADYTESIFLFLSNTGAGLILKRYEELIDNENKSREQVELRDFENLINAGAFKAQGGFHHSDTISYNLIDHYIPFLPMEKKHIIECIKDEFSIRNAAAPSKEQLKNILESVRWGLGERKQFSKTGCKMIGSRVALLIEKQKKKEL